MGGDDNLTHARNSPGGHTVPCVTIFADRDGSKATVLGYQSKLDCAADD